MKRVVVAIIKNPENNKYLLVSSSKDYGEFTGFFYPPGGEMEASEGKEDALRRELKEELNLEIEPIREIAQTAGDIRGQETYWWECRIVSGEIKTSGEIARVGYFSRKEMKNLPVWPATEAFFRDYIDVPRVDKEKDTT